MFNNIFNFITYITKSNLLLIFIVNDLFKPNDINTGVLKTIKSDETIKVVHYYDTLYMPQSPVSLYSKYKLAKLDDYLWFNKIFISFNKDIYTVNKELFLIKEISYSFEYKIMPGLTLPAAIK